MKKFCKHCGGSHALGASCPTTVKNGGRSYNIIDGWRNEENEIQNFRNSNAWKKKTIQIKNRDLYLCQVCKKQLHKTFLAFYGRKRIEVHHIVKLKNDFSKRLDDDNLICLCVYHHRLADKGEISPEFLKSLIE